MAKTPRPLATEILIVKNCDDMSPPMVRLVRQDKYIYDKIKNALQTELNIK